MNYKIYKGFVVSKEIFDHYFSPRYHFLNIFSSFSLFFSYSFFYSEPLVFNYLIFCYSLSFLYSLYLIFLHLYIISSLYVFFFYCTLSRRPCGAFLPSLHFPFLLIIILLIAPFPPSPLLIFLPCHLNRLCLPPSPPPPLPPLYPLFSHLSPSLLTLSPFFVPHPHPSPSQLFPHLRYLRCCQVKKNVWSQKS